MIGKQKSIAAKVFLSLFFLVCLVSVAYAQVFPPTWPVNNGAPPGNVVAGPYATAGLGGIVYTNSPAVGLYQGGLAPIWFSLPGTAATHGEIMLMTPVNELVLTTSSATDWGVYNPWINEYMIWGDVSPPINYIATFGGGAAKALVVADAANIVFLTGGGADITPAPAGAYVGVAPDPTDPLALIFTYGTENVTVRLVRNFGLFIIGFFNVPAGFPTAITGAPPMIDPPPPRADFDVAQAGFEVVSGHMPSEANISMVATQGLSSVGGFMEIPVDSTDNSTLPYAAFAGVVVIAAVVIVIGIRYTRRRGVQ